MTTKEMIQILQAFDEGKPVECYCPDLCQWELVENSTHQFNFDDYLYRIQPDYAFEAYENYDWSQWEDIVTTSEAFMAGWDEAMKHINKSS